MNNLTQEQLEELERKLDIVRRPDGGWVLGGENLEATAFDLLEAMPALIAAAKEGLVIQRLRQELAGTDDWEELEIALENFKADAALEEVRNKLFAEAKPLDEEAAKVWDDNAEELYRD